MFLAAGLRTDPLEKLKYFPDLQPQQRGEEDGERWKEQGGEEEGKEGKGKGERKRGKRRGNINGICLHHSRRR